MPLNRRMGNRRPCRNGNGRRHIDHLARIQSILGNQTFAVWFDTDWTPGLVIEDDSGTLRMTGLQSRPIVGQTQYTISQGTLSLGPAVTLSPNGKRILTFGGTQYLSGAATLAPEFQGSTSYTTLEVASRAQSSTAVRWCFGHSSVNNRISHFMATAGTVDSLLRSQAGSTTSISGGTLLSNKTYVLSSTYNGTTYNSWMNGVESIVNATNTPAPASLDTMVYGAQLTAGVLNSFWVGSGVGLIVVKGVLSTSDRRNLEASMGAYYGYPL